MKKKKKINNWIKKTKDFTFILDLFDKLKINEELKSEIKLIVKII
jgi:hypothetical protein